MKKHTLILLAFLALTCYAADPPAPKVERDWYFTVMDAVTNKPLATINMRTSEVKYYAEKDETLAMLAKEFIGLNQQCEPLLRQQAAQAKKPTPKKEEKSAVKGEEKTHKSD